jgi:hypothetical protein
VTEDEKLRLDYEQTGAVYRTLAGIRFGLLALVPALTLIAILVSADQPASITLAVGLLGGLATFGLSLYDLRNAQLYVAAQQRLGSLEAIMRFPETRAGQSTKTGGNHLRRPGRSLTFFGVRVAHDYALGIIYSAALGGWTFLFVQGAEHWLLPATGHSLEKHARLLLLAAVVSAVALSLVAFLQYWRIHRTLEEVRKLPPDVET